MHGASATTLAIGRVSTGRCHKSTQRPRAGQTGPGTHLATQKQSRGPWNVVQVGQRWPLSVHSEVASPLPVRAPQFRPHHTTASPWIWSRQGLEKTGTEAAQILAGGHSHINLRSHNIRPLAPAHSTPQPCLRSGTNTTEKGM